MGSDPGDFDSRLTADLTQRVAKIMLEHPDMSPAAAMQKAQDDMVTNNPFRPPTHGCPVNDLPPELLAHIFQLGCDLDDEEDEFDYEDDGIDLEDEWETDSEEGAADEEVVEDDDEDVSMRSPDKRKARRSSAAPPETDAEDSDSEDSEDDGEDVEPYLPFQILVSHVCKHWREIALGTHTLWTTIKFVGHLNAEKGRAWLERSNGLPLDIFIDCTDMHDPEHNDDHEGEHTHPHPHPHPHLGQPHAADDDADFAVMLTFNPTTGTLTTTTGPLEPEPEPTEPCVSIDDLKVILDMIMPHVAQWRVFEVSVNFYTYMYEVLSRLAQCPSAPLLEELGLYNYEEHENEEVETFQPAHLATAFLPFHGIAPKVTHVAFWGVHIAWDDALPFLQGLREIELAYHTRDVRPSFETFRAMLDASPELDLLSLCFSGPTGDMEVVEVPSLRALVLCYLEQEFVQPLVAALVLPALDDLTLDLHEEDYTDFAKQLAEPARGQTRSLLAGLTTMKLAGLHCNDAAADLVMGQLGGLQRLHIKADEEQQWSKRLVQMKGTVPMYCPKLESLRVEGMEGGQVRALVAARKAAGAPLTHVYIGNLDFVSNKDESWLRANVDTFDFFEPSDSEEEVEMEPMDTDVD